MRNFLKLVLVIFLAAGVFSSCKKDESNPPLLQFIQEAGYTYEDAPLAPGDSVKVGFSCTSNGSDALASLKFSGNNQLLQTATFAEGTQTISIETWLSKSALDEDNWVFELVDVNGNTSGLNLNLTKDLTLADVEDITGIVLGAQDNTTAKSMYSISNRATYSINEGNSDASIQAKIDFVCYSDSKNGTHLASPAANWTGTNYETDFDAWTTKNETFFILDAPFDVNDFGILTKTKIKTAYDEAETADPEVVKRKAKEMAADKIYLFKTYNGKYGAIKVNSVVEGTTGSVNFDIKIEK